MKTPASYQKLNGGSRSLDRMVRRLQLSEEVCRELRYLLTARVVDQDWSRICTMLHKWMKYAPKDVRYSRPPNYPDKHKRFVVDSNLPVLARKWDNVDLNKTNRRVRAIQNQQDAKLLRNDGLEYRDIAKKMHCSLAGAWCMVNERK